jgi:glucose/mannose-6-phosphate isomerase
LEISDLKKYDLQKMYKIYDEWPKIARNTWESDLEVIHFDELNHIVFAGMGGSGAIGEVFASVLSKSKIHVSVVNGYHLPSTVDSNTLVIPISVSGNTDETLTILESANLLKCKIVAFASGGKIQEYCIKNNIKFQQISQDHSPRGSFVRYLYSILKILQSTLKIKSSDVNESIKILENMKKNISSQNLTNSNSAISLAKWISGIPVIYYPWGLQSAAVRFKNSLNENGKIHVINEDIVKATHNDIVAWMKKSDVTPIIISGPDDYHKTKKIWKKFKIFLKEHDISYYQINTVNGSILTKLTYLIYLCDYASVYFSVLTETDPSPVEPIKYFKQK